MKQTIDLSHQEEVVNIPKFHAGLVLWIWIGLLSISVLFSFGLYGYQVYLTQSHHTHENHKKLLLAKIDEQKEKIDAHFDTSTLDAKINYLNEKLNHKMRVMQALQLQGATTQKSFSGYLHGLAKWHVPGIQVDSFGFRPNERRVMITGQTKYVDRIPAYLQSLRDDQVYVGVNFNKVTIEAHEQIPGVVKFSLRNEETTDG